MPKDKRGWILYDELTVSGDDVNQVLIADRLPVFQIADVNRMLRAPDSESGPKAPGTTSLIVALISLSRYCTFFGDLTM
ncbi:MAG: hypothetical protein JRN15_04160 [Nitrososphaerota archaeon]|nr:hypothetical protein [Nitrososphaerota archaeon]